MKLIKERLIRAWVDPGEYYRLIDEYYNYHDAITEGYYFPWQAFKDIEANMLKIFGKRKYKNWRSYSTARTRYMKGQGLNWRGEPLQENINW